MTFFPFRVRPVLSCLPAVCLAMAAPGPGTALAQFAPVWEIGLDDQSAAEFTEEWLVDDDFTVGEPFTGLERSLSRDDRAVNIRFGLTAAQRSTLARLRFRVDFTGPSWMVPNGQWLGNGWHDIRISLNGTELAVRSRLCEENTTVIVEADAAGLPLLAVNNVLRLERTGGSDSTPAGAASWSGISLDYLTLEVDETALTDADGDGLPAWWERANLRSDSSPGATADADRDGLTDFQEFTHGTNPDAADTDGDGLNDAAEVLTAPFSNPLQADSDGDGLSDAVEKNAVPPTNPMLADTDGDGAPDGWERHCGTDPLAAASVPPVFSQAVGIDFVQRSAGRVHPAPPAVAGLVPQPFWNATFPAAPWAPSVGTMSQIAGPEAGRLVNSAGQLSPVQAVWASPLAGFNNNGETPDGMLLNGFIASSATVPASVTLTQIPYAAYDVIVYPASNSDQYRGRVELEGQPATRRYFLTDSAAPFHGFREATTTQAEMDAATGGTTVPEEINRRRQAACRSGNVVRFRGLSGPSVTVAMQSEWNTVGIAAIQVVDTAVDRDGDGLPDSYEFTHRLSVTQADALADADGDGLTNAQELARGSNPRLADTDGDGLADGLESAANVLTPDADGDGLSDFAETQGPRPTNPNAADSDGDGLNDADERAGGSDPLSPGGAGRPVPVYANPGAGGRPSWTWEVPVQLAIDHATAPLTASGFGDRAVVQFAVYTPGDVTDSAIVMELRTSGGLLTWMLHTSRGGSFSRTGAPGESAWYADWASPQDLTTLLGLSGYGRVDLSQRLVFRFTATRPGTANQWDLRFEIVNLDRPAGAQTVLSRTFANTTASASTMAGTTPWQNRLNDNIRAGECGIVGIPGVEVYLGYPALESLPAFQAWVDADHDGMPDVWETTYGLNPASAADALTDPDNDGLSNRAECLAGTHPLLADTDGDGVRDGDEAAAGSDPLLAGSRPPFFLQAPPAGGDLNFNGLPDLWEIWAGSFDLLPGSDDDGDGYTNLEESRLGTLPLDASSAVMLDWENLSATTARVRWTAVPHKRHRLSWTGDLSVWEEMPGVPAQAGGLMALDVPHPSLDTADRRFYRAGISDVDSDGDGLTDWAEAMLGSSPLSPNSLRSPAAYDSNGDGIADAAVAGDYAAFAERLLGGQAGGGYPGSAGGAMSRVQAARLLSQATFGPVMPEIDRLTSIGAAAWIQDQMAQPPGYFSPYIRQIYRDFFGQQTDHTYNGSLQDSFLYGNNLSTPFFRAAVAGPDQLRQRTAFALSQILVVSRRDAALENVPLGLADFYDIFLRHAFGNYRDILTEVTLHPVMGRYLSHLGNQKAVPALNQYPDENYAREIMQLFSIGLWELNPDGTRATTPAGEPIPAYDNSRITEFARVFTGLWFHGQDWLEGGYNDANYAKPMAVFPDRHDFGRKTLLRGVVIPARAPTRENALRDIHDAVQCLFDHPNTPVFVSRQLIQFLVTSNPTPGYVQRVQQVFVNNGSGVRGDLGAVIKAILLDPEARDPRWSMADPDYGKLREPVIRTLHLARLGGMHRQPEAVWWNWGDFFDAMKQEVLFSPSVFNFYRPDYQAPGLLSQRNLSGPVFQVTDSYTAIAVPNKFWEYLHNGLSPTYGIYYPLDFAAEEALAGTPALLIDRLNLLLCAGRLTAASRSIILNAVNTIPAVQSRSRVHLAIYLCLTSPEGAVQR